MDQSQAVTNARSELLLKAGGERYVDDKDDNPIEVRNTFISVKPAAETSKRRTNSFTGGLAEGCAEAVLDSPKMTPKMKPTAPATASGSDDDVDLCDSSAASGVTRSPQPRPAVQSDGMHFNPADMRFVELSWDSWNLDSAKVQSKASLLSESQHLESTAAQLREAAKRYE